MICARTKKAKQLELGILNIEQTMSIYIPRYNWHSDRQQKIVDLPQKCQIVAQLYSWPLSAPASRGAT